MRSLPLPCESPTQRGRRTRWAAVAESLRRTLASGSRQAGELLPSTRDLALRFRVHRQTIMVALDALCAEGLLEAEPRRGFRVAAPEAGVPLPGGKLRPQAFHFRVASATESGPAAPPALPDPPQAAT
ncbi:MAG: hypothetical protein RL685_6818, partial [Pseudomonadota bacterium]